MAVHKRSNAAIKERVGRPAHKPTPETRRAVQGMVAAGLWQYEICQIMGLSENTLVKHYQQELDNGWATTMAVASKTVVDQMAHQTDRAFDAAKFFLTKRGRGLWSEKNQVELTGTNGGPVQTQTLNFEALSFEERDQLEHLLNATLLSPIDARQ